MQTAPPVKPTMAAGSVISMPAAGQVLPVQA